MGTRWMGLAGRASAEKSFSDRMSSEVVAAAGTAVKGSPAGPRAGEVGCFSSRSPLGLPVPQV